MKSQPLLVLATTSVYRRRLLERLGLRFAVAAPQVDECAYSGESALALVTRLARAKAASIAAASPGCWVIGSDQIAVLGVGGPTERLLGKPGTAARCVEQLLSCSGQTVVYLTAVALLRHEDAASTGFVDTTQVRFRSLDEETIGRYVERESPLDCAGGFKVEGLGIALCETIDSSDPSALIGLPLIRLAAALRGVGFQIP